MAGALLQGTTLRQRVNAIHLEDCPQPEVKHAEVVTAGIGLLCLGKSDFNDIEAFRGDEFFRRALGLRKVPSEATLRQRLDMLKDRCEEILREESVAIIKRHARKLTPCDGQRVPLDIDVSPFDNKGNLHGRDVA